MTVSEKQQLDDMTKLRHLGHMLKRRLNAIIILQVAMILILFFHKR